MKRIVVRYRVKPESVAENERLIKAVFEQLRREQPAGLRDASFKANDGVSLTQMVSLEQSSQDSSRAAQDAWDERTRMSLMLRSPEPVD
jgi:hypothetical protein